MITFIKQIIQQNVCPMYIAVNMGEPIDVDNALIFGITLVVSVYTLVVFYTGTECGTSYEYTKPKMIETTSITMSEIQASKILEDLKNYESSDASEEDNNEGEQRPEGVFDYVKLD